MFTSEALVLANGRYSRSRAKLRVVAFGVPALVCCLGFVAASIAAPESDLAGVARAPHAGLAASSADPPQAPGGFEQDAGATRQVQASANPLARQRGGAAPPPFRGRRAYLLDTMFQIHWHLGRPLPPAPQGALNRDVQCRKVQRQCVPVPLPPVAEPAARRGPH